MNAAVNAWNHHGMVYEQSAAAIIPDNLLIISMIRLYFCMLIVFLFLLISAQYKSSLFAIVKSVTIVEYVVM